MTRRAFPPHGAPATAPFPARSSAGHALCAGRAAPGALWLAPGALRRASHGPRPPGLRVAPPLPLRITRNALRAARFRRTAPPPPAHSPLSTRREPCSAPCTATDCRASRAPCLDLPLVVSARQKQGVSPFTSGLSCISSQAFT